MRTRATVHCLSFVTLSLLAGCGAGAPTDDVAERSADQEDGLGALGFGGVVTTTLVSGEGPIRDLAVDDASVYWITARFADSTTVTTDSVGHVAQISKYGGRPRVLAAQQHGGGSIAVNRSSVFWTGSAEGAQGPQAAIFKLSKRGGPRTRFSPSWPGFIPAMFPGNPPEEPPWLVVDEQQVYAVGDLERLYRIPISSQAPEFLVQGTNHTSLAVDAAEVFDSECRTCSGFIAEAPKSTSTSAPDGSNPDIAFVTDEETVCCVWSMAVSGSTLYWSSEDGILAAHLNGAPTPPDPAVTLVPPPAVLDLNKINHWIAVVPPNVYWSTADGTLMRVGQAGGAAHTVIAKGVNPNVRLMADSDSIYWVSAAGDAIHRTRVR
jgi:hypothetical protein